MPKKYLSATQRPVEQFWPGTIKALNLTKFPEGIRGFYGDVRGLRNMALQYLRFDATIWNETRAKKWLKEHGFKATIKHMETVSVVEAKSHTKKAKKKNNKKVSKKPSKKNKTSKK